MSNLVLATRLSTPSPRWGEDWGEGVTNFKLEHPIPLTLAHCVSLDLSPMGRGDKAISFSRRGFAPELMARHCHATLRLVTTGHSRSQNGVLRTPMPVVHADATAVSAGGSAVQAKLRLGLPDQVRQ
jgi:hypothetical protein